MKRLSKRRSAQVVLLSLLVGGLLGAACGASTLASPTLTPGSPTALHGKVKRLPAPAVALAIDGSRVAYSVGNVFVWNARAGKTTKVSSVLGDKGGVIELAVAGPRLAWLTNAFGNSESDDYLFTNSVLRPKERLVAQEVRVGEVCGAGGDNRSLPSRCAGKWLGGVVGAGNRILVNRWKTTKAAGITDAGLFVLNGTHFRRIAGGAGTIEAVAADPKRVAVLHPDRTIAVYSTTGRQVSKVTPSAPAEQVDLSGRNLVVLESHGKLALYDSRSGSLEKTFTLRGDPDQLSGRALAVQGNIAVYAVPARSSKNTAGESTVSQSAVRALNLASGIDRPVGTLPGQIILARIDSFGLAYANTGNGWGPNQLVVLPFKQVAAAVR
jgi:hypothetical protein